MSFTYDKIMNWPFEEVEQKYTIRDSIIYALGIGLGQEPTDAKQIPYVFEEAEFCSVPTMAAVLAGPGFWARRPMMKRLSPITGRKQARRQSLIPPSPARARI